MKKFTYPLVFATALVATSCSDIDNFINEVIDPDGKEMISFSMSDGSVTPAQRAVTRAGFTGADTRIVARFQSDEKSTSNVLYTRTVLKAAKDNTGGATDYSTVTYYTTDNTRYWDDAFGRKGQISVYAVAIPNSTSDTKLTDGKLAGGSTWAAEGSPNNNIQWDVTYGTQTSATLDAEDLVYSNNIQSTGTNGRYVWDYTANPEGYPADNGRLDGHQPGRLVFTQKGGALESDAGHFDKGHLMFNHALSRLTITLVEGSGFDGAAFVDAEHSDFKFKTSTGNIKLLSFPYTGTLNIKEGSWGDVTTHDIDQMIGATVSAAGDFSAQMLPGYKFYGTGTHAADNVMQFVIDDNTYYVTQKQVFDALNIAANTTGANPLVAVESDANGNYIEMKQGKNYKLSITVKKTPIVDVTATLAPWVEVAGSMEVNNAHISLTLNTTGATCDKDIDLYRLDEDNAGYDADNYDFSYDGTAWFGNYSTDAMHKTTLLQTALAGGKWTTPWYFESNKTYYHFRTVNSGTTIEGTDDDDVKDYFNIAAGPVASTDPHWGAPMKSTSTTWLKYDENGTLTDYSDDKGYAAHLQHAIGATEDRIAIQELHMMSNINVVLETPNDGGKVMLYDDTTDPSHPVGTIVKITRLAKNGTVEMGRGVVTPLAPVSPENWSNTEVTMTSPATTAAADYFTSTGVTNRTQSKTYTYAVVPQSLSRNFSSDSDNDYIGIFIQTPDHNQYYVVKKLSDITATTVTDERDQTQGQRIKRWYPGHTYTYTFTITKTGIKNVTATVADWVNVTGQNTNITLED